MRAVAILRNRTLINTFKFENYPKVKCASSAEKTPGELRVTRYTRVCKAIRREGGILMSARAESLAAPENVTLRFPRKCVHGNGVESADLIVSTNNDLFFFLQIQAEKYICRKIRRYFSLQECR